MTAFFVTGAGTDIGKTHIAAALLRVWRDSGIACDAFKPVLSGFDAAAPQDSDSGKLLAALGAPIDEASIARMTPWRFRAPLAPPAAARREGRDVPYDEIVAACRVRIAAAPGALLIEGAGGVMSPIAEGKTNLDLIAALGLPALLVVGSYLGAISHALTAIEALRARKTPIVATVISESEHGAESLADIAASLAQFYKGRIVAVPRFDTAPPQTLDALAIVLK